jgi:ATP-dependent exoDNAse (exonuclease V) beta subunit
MLEDEELRKTCMTDFDMVACVEAAAGTGKTSLMSCRVAMLLADGRPPGSIVAVTFTEAAASELARRIHGIVEKLLDRQVPQELAFALPSGRLTDTQLTNLAVAARQLDELTSTTIHSFCQSIIVDHGVSAGLDPGATTADEGVAEFMFDDAFSDWLVDALSSGDPGDQAVVHFVQDRRKDPVKQLRSLAAFWKERRTAAPAAVDHESRPDLELTEAIDAFQRWVAGHRFDIPTNTLADDLDGLRSHFADCLAGHRDFPELIRLSKPPRVFGMREETLEFRGFGEFETWASTRRPDHEALRAQAWALYDHVAATYAELMGHVAGRVTSQLGTALRKVLDRYDAAKRNAAVMDFDDLLLHARNLLRDDTIRKDVGERYRHILVDEFQDTNLVQTEILFSICAIDRQDDWRQCRLKPGSLFLVGDPKQAIYRFRQADIAAYRAARDAIVSQPGGRLLPITANFRSQRPIVDYVNSCFSPVFDGLGQPGYVALTATLDRSAETIPCVAKLTIAGRGSRKLCQTEAEKVAALCKQIIGRLPIRGPRGTLEMARPRDIALLAPNFWELWRYERALEDLRIEVTSQASKVLMRRQETQDVLVLLRTLLDPTDRLAFGAFMRGPMVGIPDRSMLSITAELDASGDPYGFTVRTPPASVTDPYARSVLETLQHLRGRVAGVPPSQLLSEALDAFRARLVVASRHRSRQARALSNLEVLVEMARQYATAGLHAFVHELQRRWETTETTPEGRGDSSDDAVQIVTMHSCKGLEWPVVIPIGTANSVQKAGNFVHRRSDDTLHWLIGGVSAPALQQARDEEDSEDRMEKQRMWYVASTRARDLLVLPEFAEGDTSSWAKVIDRSTSHLEEIDLSHLPGIEDAPRPGQANGQTAALFSEQREAVRLSSPTMRWDQPSAHDGGRGMPVLDRPEPFETVPGWVAPIGAGRIRGSVVHKLVEEILTGETPGEAASLADRARTLLDQLLAREGDAGDEHPEPSEMASTTLAALQAPDIAILRPFMVPEVSVWAREGERHTAGRADALVIAEGVVIGVVDWKTDVSATDETRSIYAAQVGDYLRMTAAVAGAIVFVSTGEILWIGDRYALVNACVLASNN